MNTAIDALREVSRRCLAAEPLSVELASWLGTSLHEFLCRRHSSVDEALGLRFARGGVPWWREESMRVRDDALRALADAHCSAHSIAARAKAISTLSERYAASAWRFDRENDDMPSDYRQTVKEHLWRAFKSGATMPLGERQLRNILRS